MCSPPSNYPPPPHKGGKICSRCGQLNIYVPNPCKMIKWNTFTLNHPPVPCIHCAAAPPPRSPLPLHPQLLATLSALSLWLVTLLTTQGAQELLQCIDAPLRLHHPSLLHPKVFFPSVLEMSQVNAFCFFSLAILLIVWGQFPQAENNYLLSIIGALWELYLRKKCQFHLLTTLTPLPHHLSR